jgi:alpha-1,6-mannosyltransferase
MIGCVATTSPRDTGVVDGAPEAAPPRTPAPVLPGPGLGRGAFSVFPRRALGVFAWARSESVAVAGLAISGLVLAAAVLIGWLGAFSLAGHPGFPAPGQDALVWLLGDGSQGIGRFTLLLAAVFVPYYAAVAISARCSGRLALAVALAGAVLLGGAMLAIFPAGAIDIFHNIMDGRVLWAHHQNPLVTVPAIDSADPLYPYLHYWQLSPSAYGPLWFLLTGPAYLAGGSSLLRSIVAYKALPFAFELASLGLIVLIVRRIDARRTAAAVVGFGWNPLVLWEIAGNGHNDIMMMSFVLLAILLLLTRFWPAAFPALAGSVLVKYVSLVLLPVFVLWVLLRYGRRAILPLANGLLAALIVALALFHPFWAGELTFAQLQVQQNQVIFSPASALIGNWGESLDHTAAVVGVERALTAVFVLGYAVALLRLRPSAAGLVRTSVEVIFLVLVLMTWWFWPWYVVWGLALAALLPGSFHLRLFALFSTTAMLIYVSSAWRLAFWNFNSPFPMSLGTALLVFLPPLLYVMMHVWERVQVP